jgi:F-type H+-transporting ATPase subunit delta
MAEQNKAYASALFALALESGEGAEISAGLKDLTEAMKANPEYAELLSTPVLPKSERAALVHQAFDGRLPGDLISFLLLLSEGGRLKELEACAEDFEALYQAHLRSQTAYVTSATELTEEQKQRLKERLEAQSGKTVTLQCSVDASLLGGVRVDFDGRVFDGSLRRRMDEIKKVLDQ